MFESRTAPLHDSSEPTAATSPASCAAVAAPAVAGSFDVALEQLVGAVASMVGSGVPADARSLVALRAQVDQLSALITEAEVRFDRHELWRDEGAGSLRGWFADGCRLGRRAATLEARRVERLEQWPQVAQAWSAGQLCGAQVDVIVGVVPRRFTALFAEHAAAVVDVITGLDIATTETAMRQWVRCAENADGPEQFRPPSSGVHFDRVLDGRYVLNGQLDGADAAIIAAALNDFDVPDPVDESGRPIGEPRSLAQRNRDALVAACRFAVAHRDGSGDTGRFLPHVSLVVDAAELRAAALRGAGVHNHSDLHAHAERHNWSSVERAWFTDALDRHLHGTAVTFDGTELDAAAVSLLTCDSIVQRVMVAGDKVLDMGREVRTATTAQRRAIITRDRHCRAPGCHTKPKHCDVHHIDHWINGGRTDIGRMVLLCGTHHRQFHRPGHHMELDDDAVLTVRSPNGWTRSTIPERAETHHFNGVAG